jgi:putative membrane protein
MHTRLQATSFRNYVSSIFGLILPNLVALGIILYQGEWQTVSRHFGELFAFGSIANYWLLSANQFITGAWILLCALIGTVHYLHKRHSDSIRTRMLYSFFIQMNTLSIIFLCLQPQHFDALLGIIIASTAPLIAHFFALTNTKFTNFTFKFLALGTIAITVFNLLSYLR